MNPDPRPVPPKPPAPGASPPPLGRPARRGDDALAALRGREVPRGLLEGLYDEVRTQVAAATPEQRWARAAMSGAFLDAPRALALWRRTALAASLLLVVGGGLVVRERLGGAGAPPQGRPLTAADPRDGLLLSQDASERTGAPAAGAGAAVPVAHAEQGSAARARRPVFLWIRGRGDAGAFLDRLPPVANPGEKEEQRERH